MGWPHSAPAVARWRALALPAFALVCWGLAVRQMAPDWTLNEEYHYGWIVPLLAAYLVRIRLENAPLAGRLSRSGVVPVMVLLVAMAQALILPLREADPEWRLLGFVVTGLAALVTLAAFGQVGGWPWMAHFAFPVLFIFTAVPWPHWMENGLMDWLMRHNARLAAEILSWVGVNATVQGNLIRLSTMTVGIEEACSGIRSLQGALMAALFVGEMFQLSHGRRGLLLLAGVCGALLTNAARTVFLALMAEWHGAKALERWHDPAGYWILGACFAGIALGGWWLGGKRESGGGPQLRSANDVGQTESYFRRRLSAAAGAACAGMTLIFVAGAVTEAWFRMQEAAVTRVAGWTFKLPVQAAHFEPVAQSDRVRGLLRCDFHSGGRWRDARERQWEAHFFRVNAGRTATRTGLAHDPRYCLGASGKELVQTLPTVSHQAGDLVLDFDAYWFRDAEGDVYVFNCVTEDVRRRLKQESVSIAVNLSSRMEAIRWGKRNLGLRRLEVAVWGAKDAAAARLAFEELLSQRIVIQDLPPDTRRGLPLEVNERGF